MLKLETEVKVDAHLVEAVLQHIFAEGDCFQLEKIFHHLDQWCCTIEDELIECNFWAVDDDE